MGSYLKKIKKKKVYKMRLELSKSDEGELKVEEN